MATKSMTEDRLVRERQLELRLGWAQGTGGVKRSRGTMPIPFVRIGNRIHYRESDINAFIEANTTQPAPKASEVA